MTGLRLEAVIRERVGRDEAEAIVAAGAAAATARIHTKVYYPYYWYRIRHSARTLLGPRTSTLACMIDARTGTGATVEPFEVHSVSAEAAEVLPIQLEEGSARRLARRFTTHVMTRRQRALLMPEIEIVDAMPVFKPFWVVACHRARERRASVLVDGVTGACQLLR